jgi:hypothetical protein
MPLPRLPLEERRLLNIRRLRTFVSIMKCVFLPTDGLDAMLLQMMMMLLAKNINHLSHCASAI